MDRTDWMYRTSYWKTIALMLVVAFGSLAGLVATWHWARTGSLGLIGEVGLAAIAVGSLLVVGGGLVCLWRDGLIRAGKPDPVGASLNRVPKPSRLASVGLRRLQGRALRPGDVVEVRPLAEIRASLDPASSLEELPFMAEMQAFCGRRFRVHRRVDKIWDMRHKTGLRQLCSVVSLTGVRCDGAHHGGCQAGCQILWKEAWLRRVPGARLVDGEPVTLPAATPVIGGPEPDGYVCQMTRLWEASRPMARFDIRQDLRPLLWGNVRPWTFAVVLLTRIFNAVQSRRGGVTFPAMPEHAAERPVPRLDRATLAVGQRVVIQDRGQIARTLVNHRNRGLWYDLDMVRYCGNTSEVQQRVERLVHEATGRMVTMKTDSWILRGLMATGEFHRLCPQHEYIHWREAWLRPQAAPGEPPLQEGRAEHGQ